jgi:hypothetical protein
LTKDKDEDEERIDGEDLGEEEEERSSEEEDDPEIKEWRV